jgi:hypothetical protein
MSISPCGDPKSLVAEFITQPLLLSNEKVSVFTLESVEVLAVVHDSSVERKAKAKITKSAEMYFVVFILVGVYVDANIEWT